MANIYCWNLYEKSFTPYWASLAPKHQVHRHAIGRKPSRVSSFWQDPKVKNAMKFFKSKVLVNTWAFHFLVIIGNTSL